MRKSIIPHLWDTKQIRLLEKHYGKMDIFDLSLMIGKSPSSMKRVAKQYLNANYQSVVNK